VKTYGLRVRVFWLSVLAGFGIETGIGQHETLDGLASDDVRIDDFVDVGFGDVPVPDGFGINDQVWSVLALIKAAGLIGAHFAFKAALRQFLFE